MKPSGRRFCIANLSDFHAVLRSQLTSLPLVNSETILLPLLRHVDDLNATFVLFNYLISTFVLLFPPDCHFHAVKPTDYKISVVDFIVSIHLIANCILLIHPTPNFTLVDHQIVIFVFRDLLLCHCCAWKPPFLRCQSTNVVFLTL